MREGVWHRKAFMALGHNLLKLTKIFTTRKLIKLWNELQSYFVTRVDRIVQDEIYSTKRNFCFAETVQAHFQCRSSCSRHFSSLLE
jgi:hypothetical protein